jgi:hypothetical protein
VRFPTPTLRDRRANVHVKQTDKVGRPDIDAIEAVMEREGPHGRQRGFFVAFGYTPRRRTGVRCVPQADG